MEIDRVGHWGVVDDGDAHVVPDANVNDRAGNGAAEGPALVCHALRYLERGVLDRYPKFLDVCVGHWSDPGIVRGAGGANQLVEVDALHPLATTGCGQSQ